MKPTDENKTTSMNSRFYGMVLTMTAKLAYLLKVWFDRIHFGLLDMLPKV